MNAVDFWDKILPDMSSPLRLLERLSSGEAYADPAKKKDFLETVKSKVYEYIQLHQQGTGGLAHGLSVVNFIFVTDALFPSHITRPFRRGA